jgi:hypothetical protein
MMILVRFPTFSDVVNTMRRMAYYWSKHPAIRDLAHLYMCYRECRFEELFDYVKRRARFRRDPVGTETLRSPFETLGLKPGTLTPVAPHGWADCDDVAVLLAAVLLAMRERDPRFSVRFVFARAVGAPEPTHVFIEAFHPRGGWVALDPLFTNRPGEIAPSLRWGWTLERVAV